MIIQNNIVRQVSCSHALQSCTLPISEFDDQRFRCDTFTVYFSQRLNEIWTVQYNMSSMWTNSHTVWICIEPLSSWQAVHLNGTNTMRPCVLYARTCKHTGYCLLALKTIRNCTVHEHWTFYPDIVFSIIWFFFVVILLSWSKRDLGQWCHECVWMTDHKNMS